MVQALSCAVGKYYQDSWSRKYQEWCHLFINHCHVTYQWPFHFQSFESLAICYLVQFIFGLEIYTSTRDVNVSAIISFIRFVCLMFLIMSYNLRLQVSLTSSSKTAKQPPVRSLYRQTSATKVPAPAATEVTKVSENVAAFGAWSM